MKVLIVDDDETIIQYLTRRIRQWGYEALPAGTGDGALDMLTREAVDLVLLDVFLVETDALDLIPKIRDLVPDIHIITMTGQSSRDLELRIRSLGILYYMEKPIESENLKLILAHMSEKNE